MTSMFDRFTDRSRRTLVLAQDEARRLNHSFIGTEHLLLGLISEKEGIASKALEALGVSLDAARRKVEELAPKGPGPPSGTPPFTTGARKTLETSFKESLQLGHNYIGTEHILLGLLHEGEGVAAQVLNDLGAETGRIRHVILQILSAYQTTSTGGVSPWGPGSSSPFSDEPAIRKAIESFGISLKEFIERVERFREEERAENNEEKGEA